MVIGLHCLLRKLGLARASRWLCKIGLHGFSYIYVHSVHPHKKAYGHCAICDCYVNF